MLGINRWQLFIRVAAILCIVGITSLALIYFIPAPPKTVTLATAFKGTSFDYYGGRYRDAFARSGVKLELRETRGTEENLGLLQNPASGVQIAFAFGGISNGEQHPGVESLGIIYNNPFWIFYASNEPLDRLSQLKGKRIAVGPIGSGVRTIADKVFGTDGVTAETATFLPYAGTRPERRQGRCCMDLQFAGYPGHPDYDANAQRAAHERCKGGGAHPYFPGSCPAGVAAGRI